MAPSFVGHLVFVAVEHMHVVLNSCFTMVGIFFSLVGWYHIIIICFLISVFTDYSSDGILELEPMNSYNRLLLHRLAEIFGYFSHDFCFSQFQSSFLVAF